MLGPGFEKRYPFVTAFLVAVSVMPFMPWVTTHRPLITGFTIKLFPSALTVSAIAIGFLATSQSILISLKDSPGMEQMKADGYHDAFVDFLSAATSLSFVLAILSAIFSALDFGKVDKLHGYLISCWAFVCVWTLLAYYRAVTLLPYVLRGAVPRCADKKSTVPFRR